MVRIVLKEEFKKNYNMRQMGPKTKAAVHVLNGVLNAVELMSTSKTIKVARLLKEVLDIFSKR